MGVRGTRKLVEMMNMFITLIVVLVSWVYVYVQSHQIIYTKYVQFFVLSLYLGKTGLFFFKDFPVLGLHEILPIFFFFLLEDIVGK